MQGDEHDSGIAKAAPVRSAVLSGWARRLGRSALDVLYPPRCLACEASTDTPAGLCAPCWRAMPFVSRPYCERLGTPFAQDLGPGVLSPEAIAHPPVFARARGAVLFRDGPAQRLVHRLKYGDRPEIAPLLGTLMVQAAADLLGDAPVLVPMPLHRRRLWQRQFNQAALLAETISRRAGLHMDTTLLQRVKATAQQVGMTRAQRAQNMQGAFKVAAGALLEGRCLLLVDDVLTTGATGNAAARALLRGGAKRVDLIVFALVAPDPTPTL